MDPTSFDNQVANMNFKSRSEHTNGEVILQGAEKRINKNCLQHNGDINIGTASKSRSMTHTEAVNQEDCTITNSTEGMTVGEVSEQKASLVVDSQDSTGDSANSPGSHQKMGMLTNNTVCSCRCQTHCVSPLTKPIIICEDIGKPTCDFLKSEESDVHSVGRSTDYTSSDTLPRAEDEMRQDTLTHFSPEKTRKDDTCKVGKGDSDLNGDKKEAECETLAL